MNGIDTTVTPAAGFTLKATLGGLCALTTQFVQASPKYQALSDRQKRVADALATAACRHIAQITPKLRPVQKTALIKLYKDFVRALVRPGWLTQDQADTLTNLANQL